MIERSEADLPKRAPRSIQLDGREMAFQAGETILEVAAAGCAEGVES